MIDKIERQDLIRKEIEEKGLPGINKSQLAKKLEVSRQTIYEDLNDIILSIDFKKDIEISKFLIRNSFNSVIGKLFRLLENSNDIKEKIMIIELLGRTLERHSNSIKNFEALSGESFSSQSSVTPEFLQEIARLKD